MNYLKTFEAFKSVGKRGKIKKHWRKGRGGVTTVMGNITDKDANLNDLMEKLVKRFKVEKVKYMNAGAFGMAFIADGDKIIKLTSNADEAAEVKGLIGKIIPGCVEYYDIVRSKKFDIWAILMQKSESLTKKEEKIFSLLIEYPFTDIENINQDSLFKNPTFDNLTLKKLHKQCNSKIGNISKSEFKSYINEYIELHHKLEKNEISTQDLHVGNMGRLDGELVHFDIMAGYTGSNELNKISKIKLN
jgi:hypothetical protein